MADFTRVDFNFDLALQLSRELWSLSVTLGYTKFTRERHIASAHKDWLGPDGNTFRRNTALESDTFDEVKLALREAADSWAQAWADATDENNRREHQAKVVEERNSRGSGERIFDIVHGDDSAAVVGPAPGPVTVPTGPDFTP